MKTTAIILAGGKSSRFGRDKSMLVWNGRRIMEHLVERCSDIADEVLVVSNAKEKFGIPGVCELTDIYKGMGPLGGIHAGLRRASHDTVFVTACDMPLFHPELAEKLLSYSTRYEAAVPVANGRIQPLFAMLKKTPALLVAESMLRADQRRLRGLYEQLHTCYYSQHEQAEDPDLFFNINYPADFERLVSGERGR